jgi:predicted small metal-binding protein
MGNECDEVITGADNDEVIQNALSHIAHSHPETELSAAAQTEVRLLISDA